MKVLITSGGTKVPIDDVRFIGNMSTGRYGAEIASYLEMEHDDVTLFNAVGSVQPEADLHYQGRTYMRNIQYKNYSEYLNVLDLIKVNQYDVIISAAAVSDYIVDKTEGKLSSDSDELIIKLKKAQKVLPLMKQASPKSLVVGFKLLVSPSYHEVYRAVQKVLNNGADLVVYNDLTEIKKGNNIKLLFYKDMRHKVIPDVNTLITEIKNEYFIRTNR